MLRALSRLYASVSKFRTYSVDNFVRNLPRVDQGHQDEVSVLQSISHLDWALQRWKGKNGTLLIFSRGSKNAGQKKVEVATTKVMPPTEPVREVEKTKEQKEREQRFIEKYGRLPKKIPEKRDPVKMPHFDSAGWAMTIDPERYKLSIGVCEGNDDNNIVEKHYNLTAGEKLREVLEKHGFNVNVGQALFQNLNVKDF